jgi:hypothetical protein
MKDIRTPQHFEELSDPAVRNQAKGRHNPEAIILRPRQGYERFTR